jgi:hypothetical protein
MRSHNDSIDTTHTPPPLSFYNTFNVKEIAGESGKGNMIFIQKLRVQIVNKPQSPRSETVT